MTETRTKLEALGWMLVGIVGVLGGPALLVVATYIIKQDNDGAFWLSLLVMGPLGVVGGIWAAGSAASNAERRSPSHEDLFTRNQLIGIGILSLIPLWFVAALAVVSIQNLLVG